MTRYNQPIFFVAHFHIPTHTSHPAIHSNSQSNNIISSHLISLHLVLFPSSAFPILNPDQFPLKQSTLHPTPKNQPETKIGFHSTPIYTTHISIHPYPPYDFCHYFLVSWTCDEKEGSKNNNKRIF